MSPKDLQKQNNSKTPQHSTVSFFTFELASERVQKTKTLKNNKNIQTQGFTFELVPKKPEQTTAHGGRRTEVGGRVGGREVEEEWREREREEEGEEVVWVGECWEEEREEVVRRSGRGGRL